MIENSLPFQNGPTSFWWRDVLFVLGAIVLVAVSVTVGMILRKRSRHHHHHHSSRAEAGEEAAHHHSRKRRRRHHHREHRPMNPTLAQTGGLPPIHPKEPPAAMPPPS
ncbi:MAG: hypothetical protein KGJ60_03325 [Verrucomicrobiota bacterium]|nr:hypothetical protein [Verrucomicrobiota bacterium]